MRGLTCPLIFLQKTKGEKDMNKLLSKIANDGRFAKGVVAAGICLNTIANMMIFVGVYYTALRKGVELQEAWVEQEGNNE